MADRRIAVIGAGMAGMAAAYELARTSGVALTLFEASQRLGGTVETVTLPSGLGEPFVIECGPDSWVSEKPAARELATELGLEDQLIYSNDAQRRTYLARFGAKHRGELIPMPDGMRMMVPTRWAPVMESPLFSWQARLAYLREPRRAEEFKQHALDRSAAHGDSSNDDADDESVSSFVRRHFGEEATRTVAGPLLAGVFGGDIETLSARAVLAPFVRMEREHGSLVTAVMARAAARQGAPEPIFTTLRTGLGTLIDRMAATLPGASVRLGTRVTGLRRAGPGAGDGWLVSSANAQIGSSEEHFDAVILATPADVTRELLAPLDQGASRLLETEATSAIVVALAYEAPAAERLRIPRGFGFLVPTPDSPAGVTTSEPSGKPPSLLAGTFPSLLAGTFPSLLAGTFPSLLAGTFMDQKFPHRAPGGAVLLRGFFGGNTAPQMLNWPDAEIAEAARAQFSRLLGPLPAACHTIVRRWPRSLPQYSVGHLHRIAALESAVRQLPPLRLVGNAYRGVGLPDLIAQGQSAAREMARCGATP